MKFSEEQIIRARVCKSVDEIMNLAKDNGIDITEGEARSYFAKLNHANCELADEELDLVCGGCDDNSCEHEWRYSHTDLDNNPVYKCKKCGTEKTMNDNKNNLCVDQTW